MNKILSTFVAMVIGCNNMISDIPAQLLMKDQVIYEEGIVYDEVCEAYDQLPDKVKDIMDEEGYQVYVVDVIDNKAEGMLLGRTYYGYKVIKILNRNYFVERTVLHEYGHALDKALKFNHISKTDEFKQIYLNEKANFKVDENRDYYVEDITEYFAQAFAEYIQNPQRLQDNTPETYTFIENCIK